MHSFGRSIFPVIFTLSLLSVDLGPLLIAVNESRGIFSNPVSHVTLADAVDQVSMLRFCAVWII